MTIRCDDCDKDVTHRCGEEDRSGPQWVSLLNMPLLEDKLDVVYSDLLEEHRKLCRRLGFDPFATPGNSDKMRDLYRLGAPPKCHYARLAQAIRYHLGKIRDGETDK